jgi:hypothetical protein
MRPLNSSYEKRVSGRLLRHRAFIFATRARRLSPWLASQRNKLLKRDTKPPVSLRITVFSAMGAAIFIFLRGALFTAKKRGIKNNTASHPNFDAAH